MKHNMKARAKKCMYGIYTYGRELIVPSASDRKLFNRCTKRKYKSNFPGISVPRPMRTEESEKKITSILDSLTTGLSNAVLIIAPFPLSSLTALLLIKTPTPSRITYTVCGMRGSQDFSTGETDFSTTHRVPILGLFENATNKVILSIEDETTHKIKTKKIKIKLPEVLDQHYGVRIQKTFEKKSIADEEDRFFLVTGGYRGATVIMDNHANIRGFLSRRPQYYGIFMLNNGHFLFSEHYYKRITFGAPLSVIMHEMDWLGRYHHSYYHPIGFHHHATETTDGHILTLSSSFYDSSTENTVIKIDRQTGEELDSLSMNDLFDDTYKTRYDWAHLNAISQADDPDELVLCLRNIHTICKVNFKEKKLLWILAHPDMFKGTAQEDLVLKPEGDFGPWFFQQHSAEIIRDFPKADPSRMYINFYDNHDSARRPVDWFDEPGTAYGLIVSVDEKARTFRLEKRFPTSYAITRSNSHYDSERNRYFTMDARLKEQTETLAADMREWDFESGELMREYIFNEDFFAIHPFTFDYEELSKPLEPSRLMIRGELFDPTPIVTPDGLDDAPPSQDREDIDSFVLYGDALGVWGADQELSEILLVGKNNTYHIDFADVAEGVRLEQPIKMLKDQYFYHLLPTDKLPADRYHIYQMINGKYYNSNKWVDIQ